MKKLSMIICAIMLNGTGCSDFLEEDLSGQLVGNSALNSVQGLEAALTGAYKGLGLTWAYGFFHSTAISVTMGGDDVTTHPASNKQSSREFDQFAVSSANGNAAAIYNGCYKTIQGANNIINNYQNTVGDQAVINQIVGEAHFLRAFAYYWLVRLYGSIPLVTNAEYSEELLTMEKTDAPAVYALIEEDLKKAEELMGDAKRDPGRPNKGSAKALLADVYLTQGGWPIKDASKYALAAAKAKEVIDEKERYGFDLVPTFAELFDNDPAIPTLPEYIFQLSSWINSGQATNVTHGVAAMPGEQSGWDNFFAEINFFNNFPEGPRKDITFRTQFKLADGTMIPWQQSQTKHPYYNKFWVKGDIVTVASNLPMVFMRYAHVLTIYAEAKARTDGPDQQAYDAVNALRIRAGLTPLSGLSAEDFAAAVVEERAWEFAAESTRWFDLVRLEMVESANANKHEWDLKPITEITKDDYVFPLPLSEILANPRLGD